jgi:hypothetical protein
VVRDPDFDNLSDGSDPFWPFDFGVDDAGSFRDNRADADRDDDCPSGALGCAGPYVGDLFFFSAWGVTNEILIHQYIECRKHGGSCRALALAEGANLTIGACYFGTRYDFGCDDDDDDDDDDESRKGADTSG